MDVLSLIGIIMAFVAIIGGNYLEGGHLGALANGPAAHEVLLQLARGLTNKLLHAPSVQLKKMSAAGRLDALAMAQELFALNEGADKNSQ